MTMIAKFDGRCRQCGGQLAKGTPISWSREHGARHITTLQCDEARRELEAQRQALYTANAQQPAAAAAVVDTTAIVAFLSGARDRGLKAPAVRFLDGDGKELRLSLAKLSGKNPGAVYVKRFGAYLGKIAANGVADSTLSSALLATLQTIAADPAAAAKAYAALSGRCSFCNLALTDAGSVEVGYGPVCASKYGLPHQPKGTPSLQRVAA